VSPYTLPEGNVAIAFSGGRTSAYMLHQILEENGDLPERVVVSFQNTGREMPETLDFVQECGERWGVRIVWLEYRPERPFFEVVNHNSASRDGEPFESLIRRTLTISRVARLPNTTMRYCTRDMKVRCMNRFLRSLGWKSWHVARGLRADEESRVAGKPEAPAIAWNPLFDAGVKKEDVSAFWSRQRFDLRLPNLRGKTPLGNCDGCFLKSEAARAALARDFPERHAWWARMEAIAVELGAEGSMAQFREHTTYAETATFVQRQGDWIFDTKDALCQADGGECTG
jgi:3'-phosphoadenosine 5'-phosphosulfate sulfotransferase (PAPS reductase)/FAD synthetase